MTWWPSCGVYRAPVLRAVPRHLRHAAGCQPGPGGHGVVGKPARAATPVASRRTKGGLEEFAPRIHHDRGVTPHKGRALLREHYKLGLLPAHPNKSMA